eukprot:s1038_g1.t1
MLSLAARILEAVRSSFPEHTCHTFAPFESLLPPSHDVLGVRQHIMFSGPLCDQAINLMSSFPVARVTYGVLRSFADKEAIFVRGCLGHEKDRISVISHVICLPCALQCRCGQLL